MGTLPPLPDEGTLRTLVAQMYRRDYQLFGYQEPI